MEQFIDEVRDYARRVGIKPGTVVQRANGGNGTSWAAWEAGSSSPTLRIVDRVRKYIADNPPSTEPKEDAA